MFKQATLQALDRFRDDNGVVNRLRLKIAIEDTTHGTLYTEYNIEGEPLAAILSETDSAVQGAMTRTYMEQVVQTLYNDWARSFSTDSFTAEEAAEMFGVSTVIGGV